jgi:hypothetical protein
VSTVSTEGGHDEETLSQENPAWDAAPVQDSGDHRSKITTLHISGLPATCSSDDFRQWLDNVGLYGLCDFFFMPRDDRSGQYSGHAYINFKNPETATKCCLYLLAPQHHQQMPSLSVRPAQVQGREEIAELLGVHGEEALDEYDYDSAEYPEECPEQNPSMPHGPPAHPDGSSSAAERDVARQGQVGRKLIKTKMCIFYRKNKCKFGRKCPFSHRLEDLRAPPELAKTKLCTDFLRGRCTDAQRCRYAHGYSELRMVRDWVYKV